MEHDEYDAYGELKANVGGNIMHLQSDAKAQGMQEQVIRQRPEGGGTNTYDSAGGSGLLDNQSNDIS